MNYVTLMEYDRHHRQLDMMNRTRTRIRIRTSTIIIPYIDSTKNGGSRCSIASSSTSTETTTTAKTTLSQQE
ncbi:hypothetical protein DERF_009949 [Dermatophagoides farinae]|uniref:Uncharacterized protein n=1 Tax=Dermatophagoides farinae TaxID=6954 RepID=A0A922L316_DERFA|nr:hypothetical protein DERF_009949 [Dermatophagoides farinae]